MQTLGFTCPSCDYKSGWAFVAFDLVELMICTPNDHRPFDKPVFTGSFYFNTDNVEDVWNKVKDLAVVCYPPENFEYGMKEFAVYDNNGYLLQFGQEMAESAID
jgi:uncharacterized glyoxalase superfamily protein PhnB